MPKFYYVISDPGPPRTQTTWEMVNDKPMEAVDELDALDQIKELEDVKRIPPTWKVFIDKDGDWKEVNRRSISRKRQEAKLAAKRKNFFC